MATMSTLEAPAAHAFDSQMANITVETIDLAILTEGRFARLATLLAHDHKVDTVIGGARIRDVFQNACTL